MLALAGVDAPHTCEWDFHCHPVGVGFLVLLILLHQKQRKATRAAAILQPYLSV